MHKNYTEEDIIELYQEHKSILAVARIIEKSSTYVRVRLIKNNVTIIKLTHQPKKWTEETVRNEALKYNSRKEFSKESASAYHAARNFKILNEVCSHMEWLGHRYARHIYLCKFSDGAIYVGLSYDPNVRFRQHLNDYRSSVYKYAKEINEEPELIYITNEPIPKDDAVALEKETISKYVSMGCKVLNDTTRDAGQLGVSDVYYSDEELKVCALKFKSRKEMKKEHAHMYEAIKRRNLTHLLDHMDWLGNTTYNNDEVLEIAKKYKTRNELRKHESRIWGYINRNSLQDVMFAHMKRRGRVNPMTYDECIEITQKYTRLADFRDEMPSEYNMMVRRDDYEQLVAHMERKIRKKPIKYKRKLMVWTQEDIDFCAEQYNLGLSTKEICLLLPNKTSNQIRNKIHYLINNNQLEPNGTNGNSYTKEIIKDYIDKNNIKYRYGKDGLRMMNIGMFWYAKRHNLFDELLPEDDGKVRSMHNGKEYIMRG